MDEPGNPQNAEELWEEYDEAKWETALSNLGYDNAPEDPVSENPEGGRPYRYEDHVAAIGLDPQWVDIEAIRQWLYTCDFGHGEKCIPKTFEYDGMPLWLIDVDDECIVPAGNRQYVALSYVWGQVASSTATTENIATLQIPGVLSEEHDTVVIPQTIRHSMKLLKLLGQRYLWVDRLCILQDDAQTKHSQLHLMGDIYTNAYLTIIDASGWDANHGLRGIQGVTEPRHLSPFMDRGAYLDYIKPDSSTWVRKYS